MRLVYIHVSLTFVANFYLCAVVSGQFTTGSREGLSQNCSSVDNMNEGIELSKAKRTQLAVEFVSNSFHGAAMTMRMHQSSKFINKYTEVYRAKAVTCATRCKTRNALPKLFVHVKHPCTCLLKAVKKSVHVYEMIDYFLWEPAWPQGNTYYTRYSAFLWGTLKMLQEKQCDSRLREKFHYFIPHHHWYGLDKEPIAVQTRSRYTISYIGHKLPPAGFMRKLSRFVEAEPAITFRYVKFKTVRKAINELSQTDLAFVWDNCGEPSHFEKSRNRHACNAWKPSERFVNLLALGLPTILHTNMLACMEAIRLTGLEYNATVSNTNEFFALVKELLGDVARRRIIQTQGLAIAKEYGEDRIARQYSRMFDSILGALGKSARGQH